MTMKKFLLLLVLIALTLGLAGCQTTTTTTTTVTIANPDVQYCALNSASGAYVCSMVWTAYFKTQIELKLYYTAQDDYDVSDLYHEVGAILLYYHQLFDKYNPYTGIENIYTINRDSSVESAGGLFGTKTVSDDLFLALQTVLETQIEVANGGIQLFNAALGPMLSLWHDARENEACYLANNLVSNVCTPPDSAALAGTFHTDAADVLLDPEEKTISFAQPAMGLDLGGFGKGYVSEILSDLLDVRGITYLLNSGSSNIKAGGNNPLRDNGDFYIVLTEPTFTLANTYFAILQIPEDLSVVTSGSYQNYFIGETDHVLYHHIIDPRTKLPGGPTVTLTVQSTTSLTLTPETALMSVTVFCEDGGRGDILSTSLYLMTLQEGLAYVEADSEIEAVWYQWDGTITISSGLVQSEMEVDDGVFMPLIGLKP